MPQALNVQALVGSPLQGDRVYGLRRKIQNTGWLAKPALPVPQALNLQALVGSPLPRRPDIGFTTQSSKHRLACKASPTLATELNALDWGFPQNSAAQLLDLKNPEDFKILSVLGDDPMHASLVQSRSQLGVQKSFPTQPMFP